MTREKYESLPLATLKELSKARKMKGVSTLKKADLIEAMIRLDEQEEKEKLSEQTESVLEKPDKETEEQKKDEKVSEDSKENKEHKEAREKKAETDIEQLDSGCSVSGLLEVMPDGFGFIRSDNYLPGENDVYVSPAQIRRFGLKTGDILSGNTRIKTQSEKFSALLYVTTVNGYHPSEAAKRPNFEELTPIFPNERIRLEHPGSSTAMRIIDLISPIGKGQRGMIVSPPKAGKTTLLKEVALSVQKTDPKMHILILLIDERPEEVTDIKEAIEGPNVEVIYSTFDELPEHHKRVSEMLIARAKRLVEHGQDVMILLDSITRLSRAYNLTVPPSGRTLSGGLDPAALYSPKRFFGAARNMREGGSLTILATALVETGSKMDDVVYEEFKGTGNMELMLDRKLQEKRVFPAIDIPRSGTRREDLLLNKEEQEASYIIRKALNGMKAEEAADNLINMFSRTKSNVELVQQVIRQKFI
jgi:transcription termination factor Rho